MSDFDELSFDNPETCPNCGNFVGQDAACPNCGAVLHDENEDLNAFDEEGSE